MPINIFGRVQQDLIRGYVSLLDIGIHRLEAILKKAKEERNQMTTDQSVIGATRNPYREGSKLFDIFRFLSDGARHTLVDITNEVYTPGAGYVSLYRRRVASALRTIRKLPGMFVDYDGVEYQLFD